MPLKRTKTVDEAPRTDQGMHVCPSCEGELVQPVKWFEEGGNRWHVDLRCPDCEWLGNGIFTQNDVDAFDEELDRGASLLVEDLRALTRTNMEDEAQRLAAALATDSILPEDF
jgi:hypothetical protein